MHSFSYQLLQIFPLFICGPDSHLFPSVFLPCKLDYDRKAENAIDYEDIDEQYEGPEIQAATEEDFLLPKKDFFSKEVSVASLDNRNSLFDDENYDEDDEVENQNIGGEGHAEAQQLSPSGFTWLNYFISDVLWLVHMVRIFCEILWHITYLPLLPLSAAATYSS